MELDSLDQISYCLDPMISQTQFSHRNQCPACGMEKATVLYSAPYTSPDLWNELNTHYGNRIQKADFHDVHYTLLECLRCFTVYQKSVPSAEFLAHLYQGMVGPEDFYSDYSIDKYLEYSREILAVLNFLNLPAKETKVFDFGMGYARWLLVARAIGCQIYGLEYSQAFMDLARRQNVTVVEEKDLNQHRFHFINNEQVFEHIENPRQTIRELAQALEPNGLLKISVPAAPNIRARIKKMDWKAPKFTKYSLNPVGPLEHIQCFTQESLDLMAAEVHLKRVRIPLSTQHKYMNDWTSFRSSLKSLLKPFMYNYSRSRNYLFYQKK